MNFICVNQSVLLARLDLLESKLKYQEAELEKANQKNAEQDLEMALLRAKIEKQDAEMEILKQQLASSSMLRQSSGDRTKRKIRSDGRAFLPQTCRELSFNGHTVDGFYQVQSVSNPKKIATVYCEFVDGSAPGEPIITFSKVIKL